MKSKIHKVIVSILFPHVLIINFTHLFGKHLLILITVLDLISCEMGYVRSEFSGFLFTELTIKIILKYFKNKEKGYIIKFKFCYIFSKKWF